jgi:hypothetical protein
MYVDISKKWEKNTFTLSQSKWWQEAISKKKNYLIVTNNSLIISALNKSNPENLLILKLSSAGIKMGLNLLDTPILKMNPLHHNESEKSTKKSFMINQIWPVLLTIKKTIDINLNQK